MQRHPALRQLSSDHHSGLVLARRTREAAAGDAHDRAYAWAALVARFERELEPHFRREETGLLAALRRVGATALVERTLREHAALRRLIADERTECLAQFADLFRAHIRFEEQILFEQAQRLLDQGQLDELAKA